MSYENTFAAIISKDGTIFNARSSVPVGVDNERVKEIESALGEQMSDMQEVIDQLFQELVDAGLREVQKTPEQIARDAAEEQLQLARAQAQEQAEFNASMLDVMRAMQDEIKGLKAAQNAPEGKSETVYPINKNRKYRKSPSTTEVEVSDDD